MARERRDRVYNANGVGMGVNKQGQSEIFWAIGVVAVMLILFVLAFYYIYTMENEQEDPSGNNTNVTPMVLDNSTPLAPPENITNKYNAPVGIIYPFGEDFQYEGDIEFE